MRCRALCYFRRSASLAERPSPKRRGFLNGSGRPKATRKEALVRAALAPCAPTGQVSHACRTRLPTLVFSTRAPFANTEGERLHRRGSQAPPPAEPLRNAGNEPAFPLHGNFCGKDSSWGGEIRTKNEDAYRDAMELSLRGWVRCTVWYDMEKVEVGTLDLSMMGAGSQRSSPHAHAVGARKPLAQGCRPSWRVAGGALHESLQGEVIARHSTNNTATQAGTQ